MNFNSFTSAHRLTGVGHSRLIMSRSFLSKNEELHRGDYLTSNNGKWKAVLQFDGNFVIYGDKPVWASDTCGSDAVRLIMQADGNLVLYNKCDVPRWHSNTYISGECDMCRLQLTNDGKLELHRTITAEAWNSANSRGARV